jgi:hypothetical protein
MRLHLPLPARHGEIVQLAEFLLRAPARQRGRLLHPGRHLRIVEVVLENVDPARVLARASGWNGSQRCAAEEGHLDVVGENVERQEPTLVFDAVERRIPLHGLAHVGHVAHDERVQSFPEVALPAWHRGDVRLHRGVAVGLRNLWIAACKEFHRLGLRACLRPTPLWF